MSQTLSVSHKGWDLKAELRNVPELGGLILHEVKHANYTLADDIRIVRIWAGSFDPGAGGGEANYLLGSTALPNLGPIHENHGPNVSLFAPYPQLLELSTTYETQGPVVGAAGESQKLVVAQRYVFTDYKTRPAHEPAGVLPAARLYPLLEFSYSGIANEKKPLRYLRVDYRMEFTIQAGLGSRLLPPIYGSKAPVASAALQQAGVFLDIDQMPGGLAAAGHVITGGGIKDVFAAAEKPLPSEMIGQGLRRGRDASDWDNIHLWGVQDPLPSTPGAFHAAHIHWRWGKVAADPSGFPLNAIGGTQFSGLGRKGGPLLDPRIPSQNLRFALTGYGSAATGMNNAAAWSAFGNPSTAVFDDLFTTERAQPAKIDTGARIVVWMKLEAYRPEESVRNNETWAGTFFPNGLYFAHDVEPVTQASALLQLNEPLHKPGTARGWIRP